MLFYAQSTTAWRASPVRVWYQTTLTVPDGVQRRRQSASGTVHGSIKMAHILSQMAGHCFSMCISCATPGFIHAGII